MGYYISTRSSNAYLPTENVEECNRIWQELNKNDDSAKSGRQWEGGNQTIRFFAWMPEDWTDLNPLEILSHMGFHCVEDSEGIQIEYYDSKTGDEEYIMQHVGHLFKGEIEWVGEEGEHWKWVFDEGGMSIHEGRVEYN